jgi:hypothetical protein
VSETLVLCTIDPNVPVIVMLYVPGGVAVGAVLPPPPPPPHAAIDTTRIAAANASIIVRCRLRLAPHPKSNSAIEQHAKIQFTIAIGGPGIRRATASGFTLELAAVEIVKIPGAVGVADPGEHWAFDGTPPVHASDTVPVKPSSAVTGIVYVTEPPAVTVAFAGLLVIVPNAKFGGGDVTVKFTLFDVCPLSVTLTGKTPASATSAAVTVATSVDGAPEISVASGVPLKFTTEFAVKLKPFTVSENCAEPATTETGEIEIILGGGAGSANSHAPRPCVPATSNRLDA